jgi:hypothetical protein
LDCSDVAKLVVAQVALGIVKLETISGMRKAEIRKTQN